MQYCGCKTIVVEVALLICGGSGVLIETIYNFLTVHSVGLLIWVEVAI